MPSKDTPKPKTGSVVFIDDPMIVAKKACIDDLRHLSKTNPGKITRNFYRLNGAFSESRWQKFFPTFGAFCLAAGVNPDPPDTKTPIETDEIVGDQRTIKLNRTRISSLEDLIAFCNIDLNIWEVERFVANKWEMAAVIDESVVVEPLFQVKATLRRRNDVIAVSAEIQSLKEQAKLSAPAPKPIKRSTKPASKMLEVALFDPHFGKLAWGAETGGPNYDTNITEMMYRRAFETLLERASGHDYSLILFPIGNDLLHSDNLEGRTTKGTYVSTDGRFQKTFTTVRKLMVECIERLRQIAPVRVVVVPGNHDTVSAWCLGDSLECYFHNYGDVAVDNSPKARKYVHYGQTLLLFTHGDKGKRVGYPLLMANEERELFGQTRFHEIHTGHLHTTKLEEQHGVRVRILPSLSPADAWHAENGFVGNQRNAEAFVWDKEEGLVAQYYYNDDSQPEITSRRIAA